MDPIGKSPIPLPFLILGKLSVFLCWLFFASGLVDITMLYDAGWTRAVGSTIAVAGLAVVVLGFIHLGKSVSVGLPREETTLRTGGIYKVTRNPMYLGGFLVCAGSCIYSVHLVNFILAALAIFIHHRIVLKEEQFLAQRFGEQWTDCAQKVPRYVGWSRTLTEEPVKKEGT